MQAGRVVNCTVTPLALGYWVLSGLGLATVLWTERGRLFGSGGR